MIKQKLFIIAITIPYIFVLAIVIPMVSCFEGIMYAYQTCAELWIDIADILITEYKKAWAKPKEPEKNMWDDEDTWGAQ